MVKKKIIRKSEKGEIGAEKNWFWWALGVFIILFIGLYFLFSGLGKFEYKGLAFEKQRYSDELTLYHHAYYFNHNKQTYKQNIYLRNDPRDNDVPVDEKILFTKGSLVFLGLNNTGIIGCSDSSIAIGTLTQVLSNPQLTLSIGTPDKQEADETGKKYVTCENWPDSNVVIVQSGDKTEIVKEGASCYVINANECEIQPAVEKFIVNLLVDARENNKR